MTPGRPSRRKWLIIGLPIVVIVIAAIVVIAVSQQSSARDPNAPTLPAGVCPAGSAVTTFTAAVEAMSADFPCTPLRATDVASTPLGNITTIHYTAMLGSDRYEVMVADFGTVFSGGLSGFLQGIVLGKTVDSSMDDFQVKQKTNTSITLNGQPGVFVTADDGTHALRMKLYAVGKKLYRVTVFGPIADIDSPAHNAFLDSLKVTAS